MSIINATYVSIWDGGTKIETSCKFDTDTNTVSDIESIDDVSDLDLLDEEYVELPSGETVRTFYNSDLDAHYVGGERED